MHFPVSQRFLAAETERLPIASSTGTKVVGSSGSAALATQLQALTERLQAMQDHLTATQSLAQQNQDKLTAISCLTQQTQAQFAEYEERCKCSDQRLERLEKRLGGFDEQLAQFSARVDGSEREIAEIEAQVQGTQTQLASVSQAVRETRAKAIQQRPFALHSAECQVGAVLKRYKFLYHRYAEDKHRRGCPCTFKEVEQAWKQYLEAASHKEVKYMASLGFTKEANEAAMNGERFVHNGNIHKLDKDLVTHSLKILELEADAGLLHAIAVVDAYC